MSNIKGELGRIVANGYYDFQQVRISQMGRIRDLIRKRVLGLDLDKTEIKIDRKKEGYKKVWTDEKLFELWKQAEKDGKISQEDSNYLNKIWDVLKIAEQEEKKFKPLMMEFIETEPIWTEFLSDIRGISSVLTANLIKNFGYCEKYAYVSCLWKTCGLAVVNGAAPKKEKGKLADYNPKLRTFCWLISDSFIKQRTPGYRAIYDTEKSRQMEIVKTVKCENCGKTTFEHKFNKDTKDYICPKQKKTKIKKTLKLPNDARPAMNKLHADLRARRKMVKIFLQHFWVMSRKLKELPINEPYPFAMLKGHKHYITAEEILKLNRSAKMEGKRFKNENIKAKL